MGQRASAGFRNDDLHDLWSGSQIPQEKGSPEESREGRDLLPPRLAHAAEDVHSGRKDSCFEFSATLTLLATVTGL